MSVRYAVTFTLPQMFSHYMMASYLYYNENISPVSDSVFDLWCKHLLNNWDNFEHIHKHHVSKEDMAAGTGFAIKEYPNIVKHAARHWHGQIKKALA